MDRRSVLAAIGAGSVALSGCLGSDDDGAGSGGGSGGSVADGFGDCSAPDGNDLEAMLPTEADVDGLSNAGEGETSFAGAEWVNRTFREGGSTDVNTVAVRFDEPPSAEEDLENPIENADSPHADVLAYVTAEEYAFIAGGFDEDHAIEMLAAFQVVDDDCAQSAVLVDSER